MKRYLIELQDYCKRFSKDWQSYCTASDAYLNGFKSRGTNSYDELPEPELKDGEHQLTPRSFIKWKEENYNLSFQEAFITFLPMFSITELRASEDKDGNVSFQGTVKRVKLSKHLGVNDNG